MKHREPYGTIRGGGMGWEGVWKKGERQAKALHSFD